MLSLIESWHCDIWPGLARLRRGIHVVAAHSRCEKESLDETVDRLLSQRKSVLPWRDAVTFHLDTDALAFLIQPWQQGVSSPQELRQLAQQQAARVLHQKESWLVGFESAQWQQPALVACLQQSSQLMLRAAARRHCLRFQGIATPFQPLLKRAGKVLPESGLFVTMGPDHTRIASRRSHLWQSVWGLKLSGLERAEQLRVIDRLCGMEQGPRYVLHSETGEFFIDKPQECKA